MKVTMMLADHAQALNGRLYIMGGGATHVVLGTPFAIALLIEVPWDQANEKHHFALQLTNGDGQSVNVPTQTGTGPLEIGGDFEVGRPPGIKKGSRLPFALALNFGPMPLLSDTVYVWSLNIDGVRSREWELVFGAVAPSQPFPPGAGPG
jgi:hypothetical protein